MWSIQCSHYGKANNCLMMLPWLVISHSVSLQLMESTLPSPSRSEGSPTRRCITPTPQSRPNKRKEHDEDHATTSIKDLLTDCSKMAALRDMCAVQGDELDESHYFGIVVAKGLRTLPDKMRADAMAQVMALLSNFRQQAFELQTTNDNKKTWWHVFVVLFFHPFLRVVLNIIKSLLPSSAFVCEARREKLRVSLTACCEVCARYTVADSFRTFL